MDESAFDGTVVLEKLAEIYKVDEFFDAIDADDFAGSVRLMRAAGVDGPTIAIVVRKMRAPGGQLGDPGKRKVTDAPDPSAAPESLVP